MADTVGALTIQLSADVRSLKSSMEKAFANFDGDSRKIERRQAKLKKSLSDWTLNVSGLKGLSGALAGLTAVGVVTGLGAIVTKSLDAASAIGDTAIQAGVTVEKLQELRYAASQSGASFQILDDGLTQLNRNLGEFINTGAGRAATAFKQIGLDKAINAGQVRDAGDAFDFIAARINKFGTESQKTAILARAFGQEAGPKLLQLMEQGQAGIARLSDQANSLGIVLSTKTVQGAKEANDKLDALFSVIKSQGIAAVSSLAPEIANLAQQITNSLPDLIVWVEKWAQYFGLIKLSPVQELQVKLSDLKGQLKEIDSELDEAAKTKANKWLNPFGLMNLNIAANVEQLKSQRKQVVDQIKGTQDDITKLAKTAPPPPKANPPPAAHVPLTDAEKALEQRRQEVLDQTVVDSKTAQAALVVANDAAAVQMLKGTTDYYAAVQKQIEDEKNAKIAAIDAEEKRELDSLAKLNLAKSDPRYKEASANISNTASTKRATVTTQATADQYDAGLASTIQQALTDGDRLIQSYKDQAAALGATVGELARQQYYQDLINEARAKGITLTRQEIEQNPALKAKADAIASEAEALDAANRKMQDAVAVSDEIRNGLSEIGTAALHGFGAMKQAAGQVLEQFAEMILQLYVIKPLLEGLGEQGTVIGGGNSFSGVGSFLSSLFQFADGGVMTSRGPLPLRKYANGGIANSPQLAMFGEGSGPEAFIPLKNGGIPVHIRMPSIPKATALSAPIVNVNFAIDASGAVEGTEVRIRKEILATAPHIVEAAVKQSRKEFPTNMKRSMRDTM